MNNDSPISNRKINRATGWSFAGEFAAKMVMPITNMILARILAPEVFGIIATINMVVGLSDIFIEAGFQLYIIQHEFNDRDELNKYASSALWVSVALGLMMLGIISVFRDTIAVWVGSPGYGDVLMVASLTIPIVAGISILQALYKRDLNYKHLFIRRILGLIVPLVVTVPLALFGWGVWALTIGSLAGKMVNLLTLLGNKNYHPSFYCNLRYIAKMAPFCLTTLVSYILSWANNWLDIFIIGNLLNDRYTGLYKNSQTTVVGIVAMFTAALTPVLFSVLCRNSDNNEKFFATMRQFTERIALILLPIGFGVLVCRRLVTNILLGAAWAEATTFIGIWALVTVLSAIYATYCREACRAKGKPYLNVIAQTISIACIIPASYFGARAGFHILIWWRSLSALAIIPTYYIILHFVLKLNPLRLMQSTLPYLTAAGAMALSLFGLQLLNNSLWFEFLLVPIGALIYFGMLCLFPAKRKMLLGYINTGWNFVRKFVKRGK